MSDAFTFTFDEDDLKESANYDDFEPGEYVGVLTAIHDAKANSGNHGKRWEFTVQGLPFSTTTWFGGRGGWKLAEVLRGLGRAPEPGEPVRINPNELIGTKATLKIGYDRSSNRPDFLTVLRVLPADVEQPKLFDFGETETDNDIAEEAWDPR